MRSLPTIAPICNPQRCSTSTCLLLGSIVYASCSSRALFFPLHGNYGITGANLPWMHTLVRRPLLSSISGLMPVVRMRGISSRVVSPIRGSRWLVHTSGLRSLCGSLSIVHQRLITGRSHAWSLMRRIPSPLIADAASSSVILDALSPPRRGLSTTRWCPSKGNHTCQLFCLR